MKTKLLFSKTQYCKNGFFTLLIIFFMTISSFGQNEGIEFKCDSNIVSFGTPDGTDQAGYLYWNNGTFGFSLYIEIDPIEGPVWALHASGNGILYPDPFHSPGELYWYSPIGQNPSLCDASWTFSFASCIELIVTCAGDLDPDTDGDGVIDINDNCPNYANADQADADNDGIGNVCDICLGFDDTADTDADTIPDGCDDDDDNDGVLDTVDCNPLDDSVTTSSANDSDNDGVNDCLDVCPGFDDNMDTDGDTIPDGCDPQDDTDTDGDGVIDINDNCPIDANADQSDADNDGIGDVCDDDGPSNNDYVIIALDEIHLHGNNTVDGNIGATDDDGKVKLHDVTNVSGSVEASDIDIDDDSSAESILLEPAVVDLPPFVFNSASDNNSTDITVEAGTTVTLDGQVYGKIEVKEGGTVVFTNSNVYLEELKTKDNASVDFTGCTNLFINKKVKLEENTSFNTSGKSVTMFVDDKVDVDEGADVTAYIYANKYIDVNSKDENPISMTGFFSGKKVKGDKTISWQGQSGYVPCEIIEPDITEEDICDCKGGMTSVTISYIYGAGYYLESNASEITDNGDGTYTLENFGDKLDKNLEISDGDGEFSSFATIHTSCSQGILNETYDDAYTVVAHTDNIGNTCEVAVSSKVSYDIETEDGITEYAVSIWPNPSNNLFNVKMITPNSIDKVNIKAFDINGRLIHSNIINGNEDYQFGDQLSSGVYFVRLSQANIFKVIKVIKQ